MIGPLEIVIILVILLLIFHRRLPGLGRSAGTQARVGSEKAREFADRTAPKAKELASKASTKSSEVGAKVSDRIDPAAIGRKAGEGMREVRDVRAEFKGMLDPPAKADKAPKKRGAAPKKAPSKKAPSKKAAAAQQ